jgi:hypothetical protein
MYNIQLLPSYKVIIDISLSTRWWLLFPRVSAPGKTTIKGNKLDIKYRKRIVYDICLSSMIYEIGFVYGV